MLLVYIGIFFKYCSSWKLQKVQEWGERERAYHDPQDSFPTQSSYLSISNVTDQVECCLFLQPCLFDISLTAPRPRASSSKRQIEDQDSIPGSSTPNGPPSKRSKRGPQVKEDVSSVTEDISTLLGGTQWKNQAIGDFGPIKQLSLSSLKALRKATEKSLKLIDKPRKKRELGCLPIVLIEAVVEAFNERLRDNSTIGRAAHLTLSSVDYVLACEILDKKIRQRSGEPFDDS